jgi:hypothetical protein
MTEQEEQEQDKDKVGFIGRIYKLVSTETDKVYVGSTTRRLQKRMTDHKYNYARYILGKYCYVTSFEIMKHFPNISIELIYEGVFETKADMYRLEGEYIQVTENCINKHIAGRSKEEYRQDKKDIIRQKKQDYREKNKEKLCEKFTCEDCGGSYSHEHKAHHIRTQKHLQAVEEIEQPAEEK